jgi:predicted TIM-barrel fold metal-dependent hydrolase
MLVGVDPGWVGEKAVPFSRRSTWPSTPGMERLLYGSDWSVCLLNGTYERVQQQTVLAITRACDEPQRILRENAERLYRLVDPAVPFVREQA